MADPWMMYTAVLFGILIAVLGVTAYLRMIKAGKTGTRPTLTENRTNNDSLINNVRDYSDEKDEMNK